MKITCASTAPDNKVAAWDRNSLFFIVPNIFTDKCKMQNAKCKMQNVKFKSKKTIHLR